MDSNSQLSNEFIKCILNTMYTLCGSQPVLMACRRIESGHIVVQVNSEIIQMYRKAEEMIQFI